MNKKHKKIPFRKLGAGTLFVHRTNVHIKIDNKEVKTRELPYNAINLKDTQCVWFEAETIFYI